MRQFINPTSSVLMLFVGSCHLSSDPVPEASVCGPHLGPFPPFSAPPGLGGPTGPRSWSLCWSGWAWRRSSGAPHRSWSWSQPQRHPGGTGAVPWKQLVCRTNSHRREQVLYAWPAWQCPPIQLPRLFEEGCQSSDELLLVHVFYSNSRHRAASMLPARGKIPVF